MGSSVQETQIVRVQRLKSLGAGVQAHPSINANSNLITKLSEKYIRIAKSMLKFDDFPSYEARSASTLLPDRATLANRNVTPLGKAVVLAGMFNHPI